MTCNGTFSEASDCFRVAFLPSFETVACPELNVKADELWLKKRLYSNQKLRYKAITDHSTGLLSFSLFVCRLVAPFRFFRQLRTALQKFCTGTCSLANNVVNV